MWKQDFKKIINNIMKNKKLNKTTKRENKNKNIGGTKLESTAKINSGLLRKIATTSLIAIAVAFLGTANIVAQPPNPPPTCPGIQYVGPQIVIFYVGTCKITFTYWYRFACGSHDVYIEGTTTSGNCNGIDIMDAIRLHIVANIKPWLILKDANGKPWTGPPHYAQFDISDCEYGSPENPAYIGCGSPWTNQWRFYYPSCTAEFVYQPPNGGDPETMNLKCPSQGYCYEAICYCWDVNGNLKSIIHGFGAYGGAIQCDEVEVTIDNQPPIRVRCDHTCW